MHLVFSTDSSNTGPGFRAVYTFIDASVLQILSIQISVDCNESFIQFPACGGVITKPNMTISPPSDANGYEHRSTCKWIIVAPVGYLVQLQFSSFDLETYADCRYDYLAIYDNIIANESSADLHPIGKYCGNEKPPAILSTTRALTLVFKSDESVNGQGFAATYDFIDGRNCKRFSCLPLQIIHNLSTFEPQSCNIPSLFSVFFFLFCMKCSVRWQFLFVNWNYCKNEFKIRFEYKLHWLWIIHSILEITESSRSISSQQGLRLCD